MSDYTAYLASQVAKLKAAVEQVASWRWATVNSISPLRVTPDGDTSPLAEAPDTLVGGLVAGDRVRLVTVARRALILGRAGGQRPSLIPMGGPLWGSVGARPVVLSGSSVVTTDVSGNARVTFATSLVGISSVTVVSGDSGAQSGEITLRNSSGDYAATSFVVHTPTASRQTRVNWTLVGWTT
jgi:hypothetical protein